MRTKLLAVAVGVVAAVAGLTGATVRTSSEHVHASTTLRAVPAPAFRNFDAASRSEVLEYARSLAFDTSYHASETRRLVLRTKEGLKEGPLASVSPEIGVTAMTLDEMYSGRIVAKVVSDQPAPTYGYGKGANYVWVDKVDGRLRAVIIPEDPSITPREFGFTVQHEKINAGKLPEARFRWSEFRQMELIWIRCADGCCLVDSDWSTSRPRPIPR